MKFRRGVNIRTVTAVEHGFIVKGRMASLIVPTWSEVEKLLTNWKEA